MRKWLSGRASPCQGEGRGFDSRLPLQKYGGCSQVVKTQDCGSCMRGFDPHHPPHIYFLVYSQVGKATDFDSVIRRFESYYPSHLFGPLAQLVEHLTFNQGVPRSSRGWITIFLFEITLKLFV